MELQLGLSLAIDNNPIESADIKNKGLEAKERERLKTLSSSVYSCNKRRFQETFGKNHEANSQAFTLRLWSGQPNDGDEWNGEENSCCSKKINEDQEESVVGWPPIKSWRKKVLHQHQHGHIANNRMAVRSENGGSNSAYIKVKMEGVPIARKINLRHYQSYQTLKDSLISMFSGGRKVEKDVSRYLLAYQDRDGDWLLAGDVPWQTFITSVQRLEIARKDGRTGLD